MTQFRIKLIPRCSHRRLDISIRDRASYLTLVRIGHIITMSPIAIAFNLVSKIREV